MSDTINHLFRNTAFIDRRICMEVSVFFLEYILYYSVMSKLCFLMPFLSLFAFFIVLTVLGRFEVNALQPFWLRGLQIFRLELSQWKFPEYLMA